MNRAIKYRAYPDREQCRLLAKTFDCCRFVYNKVLSFQKELYRTEGKHLNRYDAFKHATAHKKDYEFLKEADIIVSPHSRQDIFSNL